MQGRQQKARLVAQEEYYPDTTSKLVASKIPAGIVILPSGAKFREGETYIQRMERLVTALERGLTASKGS
jgi:zinc/manganese transport system substrate-binding protein